MRYAVGLLVGLVPSLVLGATLQVDDDWSHCHSANFRSIAAAIAGSTPGDVIEVCPGRYEESLTIPHALTVRGWGPALELRTGDPATETVLVRQGFVAGMQITASGVRIEGFTFGTGETETSGLGRIETAPSISGTTIIGNAFLGSWIGIRLYNQDPSRPARVERNRFDDCFNALYVEARNVSVARNILTRWTNGLHVGHSEDVTVANNVSMEAGVGTVAIFINDSIRVRVANNQVLGTEALGISVQDSSRVSVDGNVLRDLRSTSQAIQLSSSHSSRVINNRIVGAGGEVSRGVFLQQTTNIDVWRNQVEGMREGIGLERASRNRLVGNTIVRSRLDGIHVDSNSHDNLFIMNGVTSSGGYDANDLAPGSNWWMANWCVTDNPAGTICR